MLRVCIYHPGLLITVKPGTQCAIKKIFPLYVCVYARANHAHYRHAVCILRNTFVIAGGILEMHYYIPSSLKAFKKLENLN